MGRKGCECMSAREQRIRREVLLLLLLVVATGKVMHHECKARKREMGGDEQESARVERHAQAVVPSRQADPSGDGRARSKSSRSQQGPAWATGWATGADLAWQKAWVGACSGGKKRPGGDVGK